MELTPVEHCITSLWFISHTEKRIIVESSDIGRIGTWIYGPMYDDACDLGCVTYNPNTGKRTRWFLVEGRSNEDVYIFSPCPKAVRRNPTLLGWELHIIND